MRLCTEAEQLAKCGGTGCGFDLEYVWASDECALPSPSPPPPPSPPPSPPPPPPLYVAFASCEANGAARSRRSPTARRPPPRSASWRSTRGTTARTARSGTEHRHIYQRIPGDTACADPARRDSGAGFMVLRGERRGVAAAKSSPDCSDAAAVSAAAVSTAVATRFRCGCARRPSNSPSVAGPAAESPEYVWACRRVRAALSVAAAAAVAAAVAAAAAANGTAADNRQARSARSCTRAGGDTVCVGQRAPALLRGERRVVLADSLAAVSAAAATAKCDALSMRLCTDATRHVRFRPNTCGPPTSARAAIPAFRHLRRAHLAPYSSAAAGCRF